MALDGRLLSLARKRLAEKKDRNRALRESREAEAYAKIPALRQIDAAQRALVGEVLELTLDHRMDAAAALEQVQHRSTELCERKTALLRENGYPETWLDEVTDCAVCHDTGYLRDGSVCACLLALYEEERTREFSSSLKAGEEGFADFRLDYYTGEARDCMELTFHAARQYAVSFGADSPNLLLQGGTGLGKTFLSGCIAKVVAAKGCSVVYETAQEAFAAFEEQKFSRDGETYAAASEKVKRILNCDLLILDDLGTELTTGFTQSALYHIINTRLTERRKTLISTNLTDGELAARYIPQIASRIGGEFDTLLFMGRDIRAIKKERRYR